MAGHMLGAAPVGRREGEALTTAGGGFFVRAEVNRNQQAPLCGVAPIEVAEDSMTTVELFMGILAVACLALTIYFGTRR